MSQAHELRREKYLETLDAKATEKSQPIWADIAKLEKELKDLQFNSEDTKSVESAIQDHKTALDSIWAQYKHIYERLK